jgi:hypothetical protein
MLMQTFALAVGMLLQAAQPQMNAAQPSNNDPSQMSLAEKAALAHKASAERAKQSGASGTPAIPAVTPEQRGAILGSEYVNDFFHFRIQLDKWQPLSVDRVAVSRAMASRWEPRDDDRPYEVLEMVDRNDRILSLTLIPLSQHSSLAVDDLAPGARKIVLEKIAKAQDLTDIKDYEEVVIWGNSLHRFAAFRVAARLGDSLRVQSTQLTIMNDFLLVFSVTGDSDQDVSEALRSLKTALTWPQAGQ